MRTTTSPAGSAAAGSPMVMSVPSPSLPVPPQQPPAPTLGVPCDADPLGAASSTAVAMAARPPSPPLVLKVPGDGYCLTARGGLKLPDGSVINVKKFALVETGCVNLMEMFAGRRFQPLCTKGRGTGQGDPTYLTSQYANVLDFKWHDNNLFAEIDPLFPAAAVSEECVMTYGEESLLVRVNNSHRVPYRIPASCVLKEVAVVRREFLMPAMALDSEDPGVVLTCAACFEVDTGRLSGVLSLDLIKALRASEEGLAYRLDLRFSQDESHRRGVIKGHAMVTETARSEGVEEGRAMATGSARAEGVKEGRAQAESGAHSVARGLLTGYGTVVGNKNEVIGSQGQRLKTAEAKVERVKEELQQAFATITELKAQVTEGKRREEALKECIRSDKAGKALERKIAHEELKKEGEQRMLLASFLCPPRNRQPTSVVASSHQPSQATCAWCDPPLTRGAGKLDVGGLWACDACCKCARKNAGKAGFGDLLGQLGATTRRRRPCWATTTTRRAARSREVPAAALRPASRHVRGGAGAGAGRHEGACAAGGTPRLDGDCSGGVLAEGGLSGQAWGAWWCRCRVSSLSASCLLPLRAHTAVL